MKRVVIFFVAALFLANLCGCATTRKQNDLEAQGLRNQIQALEAQAQAKDQEIDSLKGELNSKASPGQEVPAKPLSQNNVITEIKSRPNIRQIQTALTNAGYHLGPIDGKMGKQTHDAIKAFQKSNNLAADGKVGKATWDALKEYLYKKVK